MTEFGTSTARQCCGSTEPRRTGLALRDREDCAAWRVGAAGETRVEARLLETRLL